MRIALACERGSKVKCVHEGAPPCHGCVRNNKTATCVLSTPTTVRKDGTTVQGVKRSSSHQASSSNSNSNSNSNSSSRKSLKPTPRAPSPDFTDIDAILAFPGIGSVPTVLTLLRRKYPHLGFLHPSQNDASSIGALTLAAIVVLVSRFVPGLPRGFDERCAPVLRRELLLQLVHPPDIRAVQALTVASLFEWGQGVGYRAWMWIGMGVRMAQSLVAMRAETAASKQQQRAVAGGMSSVGDEARERENRTIWSCFVVDKFMSCGARRPATMTLEGLGIPLPLSEQDYAFGSRPAARHTYKDVRDCPALKKAYGTVDHHFYVLCRGIDIWGKIYGWVADGGRKMPGMVEPENAPWLEESHWSGLKRELCDWRDAQEDRLKYPQANVAVHAVFGHAEVFALINLTFYLSIIFLRREYIPSLPVGETAPRGPIDPPFLTATAPAGWWDDNAAELFDAAAQITYITEELLRANAPLMMPYAGFGVYTAAAMNLYIAAFPGLNHGRSARAAQLADCNVKYLRELQTVWRIAEEWVSVVGHARSLFARAAAADKAEFADKALARREYAQRETSMTRFGTLEPQVFAPPPAQNHDDDGSVSGAHVPGQAQAPAQAPAPAPGQAQHLPDHHGRQAHMEPAAALVELSGAEAVLPDADPSLPPLYDYSHHPWSLDLMSLNAFDWMATPEMHATPHDLPHGVGFEPPM